MRSTFGPFTRHPLHRRLLSLKTPCLHARGSASRWCGLLRSLARAVSPIDKLSRIHVIYDTNLYRTLLCNIHYWHVARIARWRAKKNPWRRVYHEPTRQKYHSTDSSLAAAQRVGGRGVTGWSLPVAAPRDVATGAGRTGPGVPDLRGAAYVLAVEPVTATDVHFRALFDRSEEYAAILTTISQWRATLAETTEAPARARAPAGATRV